MVRFSVWEVIYLVWSVPSCCGVHRSSCRMSTARSFPRKKIGRTVNLMAHPHLLPKLRMVGTILPPPRMLSRCAHWRMLSRCAHWRMYLYCLQHEMNTGFWAGQGDKGRRNVLWDCFFIYFSCGRSLVCSQGVHTDACTFTVCSMKWTRVSELGKEIKVPEIFSEIVSSFIFPVDVLWFWKQTLQIPRCFDDSYVATFLIFEP